MNGKELVEAYVPASYLDGSSYRPAADSGCDNYFVMGDHRDSSNDSRVFGPVGAAVHLRQSGFCILAGGSFRIANFDFHGERGIEMNSSGGHTDAGARRSRDSRARGRTSHLTAAQRALARAAAAKSFLIPASLATRKFSPTPAIPGRSFASRIRILEMLARIATMKNPLKPYIEALVVREFSPLRFELALHRIRAAISRALRRAGHLGSRYARARAASARCGRAARSRRDGWHAGREIDRRSPRAAHDGRTGTRQPRHVREEVRLDERLD